MKTNNFLTNLAFAGLVVLALTGGVTEAEAATVNWNSVVQDDIEYYMETDKSVYSLGENVQMLYRVTNLGDTEVTFQFISTAQWNFWVDKDDTNIWRQINGWYLSFTEFTLSPNESKEFSCDWDMRDTGGNLVAPREYDVIGGLFNGGAGTDEYSRVSVPIQIVAEPILAEVEFKPETVNLKSKGNSITCFIQLPEGYDISI